MKPKPPVDAQTLRDVTQVLEALAEERLLLDSLGEAERKRLLEAAGRVAHPETDQVRVMTRALRKRRKKEQLQSDREARASTVIRVARQAPVFVPPSQQPALPAGDAKEGPTLKRPRNCYVCKAEYTRVHFFYDALCVSCGDFNYRKRFPKADLSGYRALLTGGRVKIGFQASLLLLRAGAHVIVTTRFPYDAAERYAREPDFDAFKGRLELHGLDLRHAPSVEVLARHLCETHPSLDILINNAAQTVRRPPGFYGHLLPSETRRWHELSPALRPLLEAHRACVAQVSPKELHAGPSTVDALASPSWRSADPALGIHSSAALSLLPYAFENEGQLEALFPQGKLDADLQQVDLRTVNSWRLTLGEVATAELLEVYLVNAVAPFILCGKLKPLLLKDRSKPGHIVNVSAMEGVFSRGTKTDKHPHTNMAKAALNMLTLTSAPDYAKSGLYMNAVDTGWVTDEDPAHHAERKVSELDFQPPLDIVDGAARVVDPVFNAVATGELPFGKFLKDYKQSSW